MAIEITPSGGSPIACDILRGNFRPLVERLDIYNTPGVNGYGVQKLGKKDSPFIFKAIKYGSEATVETFATNIAALQGQICTFEDDWGQVRVRMLVAETSIPEKRPEIGNGGAKTSIDLAGVQLQDLS